jgi:hypothetical protein
LNVKSTCIKVRSLPLAAAVFIGFGGSLSLAGCAYALQPVVRPSQYRLKIAALAPTSYSIRLRVGEPREYRVPENGRVILDVPAYRPACKIYIFGPIKLGGGASPLTAKTVDVGIGGKVLRQLSLKQIATLPVDVDGYRVLAVRAAK